MININWQDIRVWKGTQHAGFEELCIQLADAETPEGARFIPLGTPDGGVECYCVLDDQAEWGWQAKYFLSALDSAQWRQIDHSVETALDKHPSLMRYFICVPLDRPDPRIPGQRWEMDRWNNHVDKWERWARDRDMRVEFVWWGSSELLNRLSQNEHIGRRLFWFGQRSFDQDWFVQHLEEAIKDAGPRYSPKVHVDLPIIQDMDRFARSASLFDEIHFLAKGIRRSRSRLMSVHKSLGEFQRRTDIDQFSKATSQVLGAIANIETTGAGLLPLADIIKAAHDAEEAGDEILKQIRVLQHQPRTASEQPEPQSTYRQEPYSELRYWIHRLMADLREAVQTCEHAESLANSQLLLLTGEGGTGKTHLLCDLAVRRLSNDLPTILLLGQWFRSESDPWTQLLQKLDLSEGSSEALIGALEAAAQASKTRALVIVDALNEGNGRNIWPFHLASFLARLEKSPWIGVILSVRSSYADLLVEENVRQRSTAITHHGFQGQEYDATRIFFSYYGLESPSFPILRPEFSNPLFLKTLCEGLKDKGETTIPRGYQGITDVFGLYLDNVNRRLAMRLDYNPGDNLVKRAIYQIAKSLSTAETRWISRSVAEESVNQLLPGRNFSDSLYQGLVTEGVLIQEIDWREGHTSNEMASISYDRFADHIIADYLIRDKLASKRDAETEGSKIGAMLKAIRRLLPLRRQLGFSKSSFQDGGDLEFLEYRGGYVRQGLLEALCIQTPEHTGQELVRLAPSVQNLPGIGDAFLESIVWRRLDAYSDDTTVVLNELIKSKKMWRDPLATMLMISTLPDHPYNSNFLDQKLRGYSMADRDAWWSIYLHDEWQTQGPVDRLVEWATGVSPASDMDEGVLDLSAIALSWMLTTPNRRLRDKATKALVILLRGRLNATWRLVDKFADVDDPYLSERVLAVAYGIAMGSSDSFGVGRLGQLVYERVFATGTPPVHILARDYARGVIERALYLGADLSVDESLYRPPYSSVWPSIPDQESIDNLFRCCGHSSRDSGDLEWSRDRIRQSVMDDDFSHYVIGGSSSSKWLSLRIDDEPWRSPDERHEALSLVLSESERSAWDEYYAAKSFLAQEVSQLRIQSARNLYNLDESTPNGSPPVEEAAVEEALARVALLHERLMSELTEVHRTDFEQILADGRDWMSRVGPRFDKDLIRRYIIWRVFDLGWTIDRFGKFDRYSVGYAGRNAHDSERFGKKYQWIAYQEIIAHIADHFQYRDGRTTDSGRQYLGPWQEDLRDIDPSCTLPFTHGGEPWQSHCGSWWATETYSTWHEEASHLEWLSDSGDIPEIRRLIEVANPSDGVHWLNAYGSFLRRQPHPANEEPIESSQREVWIGFEAYFVPAEDAEDFMNWARSVDFWGRWMPKPPTISPHSVYIGEKGWAPAYEYFCSDASESGGWTVPQKQGEESCPTAVQIASFEYIAETGGYDCSIDQGYTLRLPRDEFVTHLRLRWSCNGADYVDENEELAAFDPTVHEEGETALLLRKDLLDKYLADNGLAICWVVLGEKQVIGGQSREEFPGRLMMSGAYLLGPDGADGFLNHKIAPPSPMK